MIMKDTISVEALIDRYIRETGLTEGSLLPRDEELAKDLQRDVEDVSAALVAAEKKQKVKRQEDGQIVVLSPPVISDLDIFSLTKSAQDHGQLMETEVVEKTLRSPLIYEDDENSTNMENKAHEALGLREGAPFIVIARRRLLNGEPRAIHRVYLNPDKFLQTFLEDHNFEKESLIHIYSQCGYKLTSRDTTLTARYTNLYERNTLEIDRQPILEAEQKLFAADPETGEPFVLEFLQAGYHHWKYEIKNRLAG